MYKRVITFFFCDGLRKEPEKGTRKRKTKSSMTDSSDSDAEDPPSKRSKKGDRDGKVERCVEELKEKHGQSAYTMMQYRIWAELLSGGVFGSAHSFNHVYESRDWRSTEEEKQCWS